MSVDDVYQIMLYAINNSVNGDLSPSEFNRIIKLGEYSFVNTLLGSPEEYQYSKPVPRIHYSLTEGARQKLTPLIDAPVTISINGNGIASYPTYFIQTDAMYTSAMGKVTFVQQDKLTEYLESTIDPIADNPIYLIQKNQFQFYPVTLGAAIISFIKSPVGMKWAYTPDDNDRPLYDADNSIQPIWANEDLMEIMVRALSLAGVNLQLPLLYQYAETIKEKGA